MCVSSTPNAVPNTQPALAEWGTLCSCQCSMCVSSNPHCCCKHTTCTGRMEHTVFLPGQQVCQFSSPHANFVQRGTCCCTNSLLNICTSSHRLEALTGLARSSRCCIRLIHTQTGAQHALSSPCPLTSFTSWGPACTECALPTHFIHKLGLSMH